MTLTPEQEALRDSARRFFEREYGFEHRQALLRTDDGFSSAQWATFAELGWLGAGLAEELGGFGGGPTENALLLEEAGRALALEPLLPAMVAVQAIAAAATEAQRDDLLAAIIGGEQRIALAHDESKGGVLDGDIATRAEPDGDGWVLSGVKSTVLAAPSADVLLVSAKTPRGLSLFLVPADAAGVALEPGYGVDGRRLAAVRLDKVRLGADALVGAEGQAADAIALAQDHLAVGLCAEALGAMDAALWMTRDYLKTRQQFGVTLNTFQALQHRMADMLVETELARSMLLRAVDALSGDDAARRGAEVSAAKVQITEAAVFVTGWAIQLHGGIGVTEEYAVGHFYKRAVFARGYGGANDLHLARFARYAQAEQQAERIAAE